jgi:hypothetical protein
MGDGKQWWSNIRVWKDMCEAAILYSLYPTLSYDASSVVSATYTGVFPNVPPQPGMPCQGEDREYFPFLEQIVGAQTTLANLTKNTLATTKVSLQLLNNVHDVN